MLEFRSKKKLSSRGHFILRSLAFLLLILLFLSSRLTPLKGEKTVLSFVQNLVYPFELAFDESYSFVKRSLDRYWFHVSISEKNEILKVENEFLKTQILDYKELKSKIVSLEKKLSFSSDYYLDNFLSERIIGRFKKFAFEGIRLSGGSSREIKPGFPVVSSKGVLGKVIRTSYAFSDVLLITDANFVLDVMLDRTRLRVLLKGASREECLFELPKYADLKIGDTLSTSGLLEIFPRGLPVGVVVQIELDEGGTVKTARVKPFAEADLLESAFVLKRELRSLDPPEEVLSVEPKA